MKAGIITFHKVNNYGAVLQNYALQKALSKLGCDAETIDYHCNYIYKPYRMINFKKKGIAGYIMGVGGYLVYSLRGKKTRQFRQKLKISRSVNEKNIEILNEEYDLFLTGSDQVWNHQLTNFDKTFFLDFVKNSKKKASYAPSFGLKEIKEQYQDKYKSLLLDFQHLSVREKQGVKIIKELLNMEIQTVVDPTLLLTAEEWLAVTKYPKQKKGYILVYQLGFCAATLEFVQVLAKEKNLQMVCLPFPMGKWISCKWGLTEGPAEFLGLIKNAKYVVTSSFHGAIFSILFNKDFFIEIPQGIANVSSRLEDLLDWLGLKDRYLVNGKSDAINKSIDYTPINQKISFKRNESIEYLNKMLYKTREA